MITNKEGKEIRLIKLEDLCKHCMSNKHDFGDLFRNDIKTPFRKNGSNYIETCINKANGCDGFTECDTCPIWNGLQCVMVTNVLY